MAKLTIYIPDRVSEKLNEHKINKSIVARKAYEREIKKIEAREHKE